ncbi:hypothetical protein AC578_10027 [Pseudocercospora eumusae]|uniref:Uncharacterized protein n=1 Tax=Pseudocercospora eumusae TaxID=321146 RepID=A0A139H6T7_9PEZI|nr:hypothetical protein AC578_10027 [Pseudocercospora eumusae]
MNSREFASSPPQPNPFQTHAAAPDFTPYHGNQPVLDDVTGFDFDLDYGVYSSGLDIDGNPLLLDDVNDFDLDAFDFANASNVENYSTASAGPATSSTPVNALFSGVNDSDFDTSVLDDFTSNLGAFDFTNASSARPTNTSSARPTAPSTANNGRLSVDHHYSVPGFGSSTTFAEPLTLGPTAQHPQPLGSTSTPPSTYGFLQHPYDPLALPNQHGSSPHPYTPSTLVHQSGRVTSRHQGMPNSTTGHPMTMPLPRHYGGLRNTRSGPALQTSSMLWSSSSPQPQSSPFLASNSFIASSPLVPTAHLRRQASTPLFAHSDAFQQRLATSTTTQSSPFETDPSTTSPTPRPTRLNRIRSRANLRRSSARHQSTTPGNADLEQQSQPPRRRKVSRHVKAAAKAQLQPESNEQEGSFHCHRLPRFRRP